MLDPRIKLALLPLIGFLSFFIKDTLLLLPLLGFACLLYVLSHTARNILRYLLFFGLFLLVENSLPLTAHSGLVFAVYMVLYFLSRMLIIAMFGSFITKTTSISEMIEAMNRMKVPRCVSIPFSVLLRFAPTIGHEMRALQDSIRVRGVLSGKFCMLRHPVQIFEYTLVPLLMRALKITDELSASALIRGLDSEKERITLVCLKVRRKDWFIVAVGILTVLSVIIVQGTI